MGLPGRHRHTGLVRRRWTTISSRFENLAGREQRGFAFGGKRKWYLRDDRFDDGVAGHRGGRFLRAQPLGTVRHARQRQRVDADDYRPYPYRTDDGRDEASPQAEKVVRGGSWYVKPAQARSAYRWKYPAWRKVFNVGFRVILPVEEQLAIEPAMDENADSISEEI